MLRSLQMPRLTDGFRPPRGPGTTSVGAHIWAMSPLDRASRSVSCGNEVGRQLSHKSDAVAASVRVGRPVYSVTESSMNISARDMVAGAHS
jgi:hypothetical protein